MSPVLVVSQAIPVFALAPILTLWLGFGLAPKIAMVVLIVFVPVAQALYDGLMAPPAAQMDVARVMGAGRWAMLRHLRLPASLPYLFASLKVAVAAALVGTIVGELPAGATQGLGARLLSGSYYGQTIQIWAALFAAAILAAALVWLIGLAERITLRRMGLSR